MSIGLSIFSQKITFIKNIIKPFLTLVAELPSLIQSSMML